MKSAYRAPTARKDNRNWLFTPEVVQAYNNDLHAQPELGDRFTFTNGPYGGGRKFEVVQLRVPVGDGMIVVAKEI